MWGSSELLLNIRLWLFSIAFIHLVVTAVITLSIDMSGDADPKVRAYIFVRWRLLTCWFNIINLVYLPICIYCDWKEKQGQKDYKAVVMMRKVRDITMTSILFPTTMYADTIFWRLWHKDKGLIAPPNIFAYMPGWANHSLHTVSMVCVVLDLLLIRRHRPRCLKPGLALMTAFFATYSFVLFWNYWYGTPIYALFDIFDNHKLMVLVVFSYTEFLFYFMAQWCIIDLAWGRSTSQKNSSKKIQ